MIWDARSGTADDHPNGRPLPTMFMLRVLFIAGLLLVSATAVAAYLQMLQTSLVALALTAAISIVFALSLRRSRRRKQRRQMTRTGKRRFPRQMTGSSKRRSRWSKTKMPTDENNHPRRQSSATADNTERNETAELLAPNRAIRERGAELAHATREYASATDVLDASELSNRNTPIRVPTLHVPLPAQLPAPPVFANGSPAGQTPWHLPVGASPSGLAADAARIADLEVRAASVVGAGHRCQEPAGPRQDAYILGRTPSGDHLVVAVADGVAGSSRSDLGARVAVSTASRELVGMVAAGGISGIDRNLVYNRVAGEMLGTGRSRGLADDDICSILILAVIPTAPNPAGSRTIWFSWIGDVSLWLHRDGLLRRTTGSNKSGLDRNVLPATLPFNPDQSKEDYLNIFSSDRLAIMTDGLSDTLDRVAGAFEFFTNRWAGPAPHPAAFLHDLCYDGPGQLDDRTAVVVWCGHQESLEPPRDGWHM
jgi:protein phosphatase 2C-like protein